MSINTVSNSIEVPIPPDPLTEEELATIAALSIDSIQTIDATILSHAHKRWKKVAMVVGLTMEDSRLSALGLPDLYFAQRVRILVEKAQLEGAGNLDYMRFSEVRLPSPAPL